ncbi:MAG: prepilin-type N-terminal cleavage/methylation domain-containing protein, partial [Deltaproteobacteria bacterium]|nr:prepilin-type N-terminal cleavage/methylation domain-containing protein [Deltaproteobacteria bacterium]
MLKCLKVGTTNRGFTLIEVLVSLGTMAIGFVILMGLHYS